MIDDYATHLSYLRRTESELRREVLLWRMLAMTSIILLVILTVIRLSETLLVAQ